MPPSFVATIIVRPVVPPVATPIKRHAWLGARLTIQSASVVVAAAICGRGGAGRHAERTKRKHCNKKGTHVLCLQESLPLVAAVNP